MVLHVTSFSWNVFSPSCHSKPVWLFSFSVEQKRWYSNECFCPYNVVLDHSMDTFVKITYESQIKTLDQLNCMKKHMLGWKCQEAEWKIWMNYPIKLNFIIHDSILHHLLHLGLVNHLLLPCCPSSKTNKESQYTTLITDTLLTK